MEPNSDSISGESEPSPWFSWRGEVEGGGVQTCWIIQRMMIMTKESSAQLTAGKYPIGGRTKSLFHGLFFSISSSIVLIVFIMVHTTPANTLFLDGIRLEGRVQQEHAAKDHQCWGHLSVLAQAKLQPVGKRLFQMLLADLQRSHSTLLIRQLQLCKRQRVNTVLLKQLVVLVNIGHMLVQTLLQYELGSESAQSHEPSWNEKGTCESIWSGHLELVLNNPREYQSA